MKRFALLAALLAPLTTASLRIPAALGEDGGREAVVPAGQEELLAQMLGKGETLPNFVRGGYDKDYVQNTAYGAGATPEAIAAADAAKEEVKALKPVFVGPLKDNAGNIVIAAGAEHPPYDVWLEQTNYLVEGVIGSIT